jgi:hypothetical protein
MKQTAVECYNQEIKELFNQFQDKEISGNMFHVQRLVALTKAKEMEKQQIIESYCQGCFDITQDEYIFPRETADEYYNKTFKNTNK